MEVSRKLFRTNGFEFPFTEASSEKIKFLAHLHTIYFRVNAPMDERMSRLLGRFPIPYPRRLGPNEDPGNFVPDMYKAFAPHVPVEAHTATATVEVEKEKLLYLLNYLFLPISFSFRKC